MLSNSQDLEARLRITIKTKPELLKLFKEGLGRFQELRDCLFDLLKNDYRGLRKQDILNILCKIENGGGL